MDEEKNTSENREELVKSISTLLDETIAEVEQIMKGGDVKAKDESMQSDENGDMPKEASSIEDGMKSLKKEDEDCDESEDKKKKVMDEDKKDEETKKSEDDIFKEKLVKALEDLGLVEIEEETKESVEKSEDKAEGEKIAKSDESKEEELKKALESRDNEIRDLKKALADLTGRVEKIAAIPFERKSISGLKPIRKSESDDAIGDGAKKESLNKNEVLDKLLDLQKSGDKRVTPILVAKFERSGDLQLVEDIIKK